MTAYEVGSIANFISQKPAQNDAATSKKKKSKAPQKDQTVLDALFSGQKSAAPLVVANVPVPESTATGKKKKRKRKADEFSISSAPKSKKTLGSDDEDERLLDAVEADHAGETNEDGLESEKVARKMKKNELRNIKKNEASKGVSREDDDRVILVKNLPIKVTK